MTTRERWTVYPLLILALGISLPNKLAQKMATRFVECRELSIVDSQGTPVIRLTAGKNSLSSQLLLLGEDGRPRVTLGVFRDSGIVETLSDELKPLVQLRHDTVGGGQVAVSDPNGVKVALGVRDGGGVIETNAGAESPLVRLRHNGQKAGVISIFDSKGTWLNIMPPGTMAKPAPPSTGSPSGAQANDPIPSTLPETSADADRSVGDQPDRSPSDPGKHQSDR